MICNSMTKPELIELINKLENNFIVTCLSLGIIHHPQLKQQYLKWLEPGSKPEFQSKTTNSFYGGYETHKVFKEFFEKNNNIDYMKIPAMAMIALIHDAIKDNGFNKQTPEFEFLRHLRNAVSHGNKFTFYNGEPSRKASFQGLNLDSSFNGKSNVIRDIVDFGDVLGLIAFIKANL